MVRKPIRPMITTPQTQSSIQILDSKINLIAQKLKTMEKNEEIMGRTLIALNNKMKALEERVQSGGPVRTGGAGSVSEADKFATKQELQELKYILDNLNPLEFATIDQVKELLKDREKRR